MLAEATYRAVREREQREPDVVGPVLALLADPDHEAPVADQVRQLAAALSEQREAAELQAFLSGALTTPQVIARVASWNDRRTIASARRRGQLLGLSVGRETYHPDWQFTSTGLRADLGDVLGPLLDAAGGDLLLADRIMRAPRTELEGKTLASLLISGRSHEVATLLERYRDGFTA